MRFEKLAETKVGEESASVRKRVTTARKKQRERFQNIDGIITNSEMQNLHIKKFCPLGEKEMALLRQAVDSLHLSARAFHRIIKIARTIADLADSENIEVPHLAEAIQYRQRQI